MPLSLEKVVAVAFYRSLFSLFIALQAEFDPLYIDTSGGPFQTIE